MNRKFKKIGKKTFFGTNSTILENLEVSENCIIGASALVTKNILLCGTYTGIPAKKR